MKCNNVSQAELPAQRLHNHSVGKGSKGVRESNFSKKHEAVTESQYHITMAIILLAKKLQSLLQKENESFLVFDYKNSRLVRVVGMTEYLEQKKQAEDKEGRVVSRCVRPVVK
jgi:hypothetical protein